MKSHRCEMWKTQKKAPRLRLKREAGEQQCSKMF